MKIAHIASVIDCMTEQFAGGRGRATYLLAKKQAEKGHDVIVVGAPNSIISGCETISFEKPSKSYSSYPLTWLSRRKQETKHVVKSYSWLRNDYDIIHNHIEYEGVKFSRLTKTPCVTTLHGPNYAGFGYIPTTIYSLIRKTKLIAYSKLAFNKFKKIFGRDLIDVVYGGIDINMFPFVSEPKKRYELNLCCVGRIVPEKGVHFAIKIVDELHANGIDVHLNILGTFSPTKYFKYILKECVNKEFINLIINAGVDEVALNLGNSDALIFPIQWDEPFGRVMVESMSCGTPVITFNRGSTKEILTNGITGHICNGIKDMIKKCLQINKLDREECRKTVEKKYTMDVVHEKHIDVYEKVIDIMKS